MADDPRVAAMEHMTEREKQIYALVADNLRGMAMILGDETPTAMLYYLMILTDCARDTSLQEPFLKALTTAAECLKNGVPLFIRINPNERKYDA